MEDKEVPQVSQRPTKKQQELLEFIRVFVEQHGYGPSYREIMTGCNYTSVATVSVHVQNLISRGHLRKNGRSARSLEIIGAVSAPKPKLQTNLVKPAEEKWLTEKVAYIFDQAEKATTIDELTLENLSILVQSLKVLGLEGPSLSFATRLSDIKKRLSDI